MIGAGLLARNAVERGLEGASPGSRRAWRPARSSSPTTYKAAGLLEYLAELGFNIVGYGCTTCIGNSGPLPDAGLEDRQGSEPRRRLGAQRQPQLRRPHPVAGARELPGVAAARRRLRACRQDADRSRPREPLGTTRRASRCTSRTSGRSEREIQETMLKAVRSEMFRESTRRSSTATNAGVALEVPTGERFEWDETIHLHQEPAVLRTT